MRRATAALALAAMAALLLGSAACLTHLSPGPGPQRHLKVRWEPDFATARARATQLDKPLLVCLVAGELAGLC